MHIYNSGISVRLSGVVDGNEILHAGDPSYLHREVAGLRDLEGRGYQTPQVDDSVECLHGDLVWTPEFGAASEQTPYLRGDVSVGGAFARSAVAECDAASRLGRSKKGAQQQSRK